MVFFGSRMVLLVLFLDGCHGWSDSHTVTNENFFLSLPCQCSKITFFTRPNIQEVGLFLLPLIFCVGSKNFSLHARIWFKAFDPSTKIDWYLGVTKRKKSFVCEHFASKFGLRGLYFKLNVSQIIAKNAFLRRWIFRRSNCIFDATFLWDITRFFLKDVPQMIRVLWIFCSCYMFFPLIFWKPTQKTFVYFKKSRFFSSWNFCL